MFTITPEICFQARWSPSFCLYIHITKKMLQNCQRGFHNKLHQFRHWELGYDKFRQNVFGRVFSKIYKFFYFTIFLYKFCFMFNMRFYLLSFYDKEPICTLGFMVLRHKVNFIHPTSPLYPHLHFPLSPFPLGVLFSSSTPLLPSLMPP